jgi:predicted NBD/HSP70 family sugar kinase
MPVDEVPSRAGVARWQGALDVLRLVRRQPGITRAAAARAVGLSSGSAAEITARLRELRLLDERPAASAGRGRPTTTLHAGPDGPLVAVVAIRHEDWEIAVADLAGGLVGQARGRRPGNRPAAPLAALRRALDKTMRGYGNRLRSVSVAVAGTVQDNRLVQASTLGWPEVDLGDLGRSLPLLVGNDASLSGVAEARRGTASGARTVLHLIVEVGVGGVLVDRGTALAGATGAGGEFGHLPFGDPALACPCGAYGCWDLEVDGRAMARHRGQHPPTDPWSYAAGTLAEARAGDPEAGRAVRRCATALGRGVAGLVNALDPDLVTLGGFAAPLLDQAAECLSASYTAGLMAFRRPVPPPLRPASLGARGPLIGAAEVAFDAVLTERGLTEWSARATAGPPEVG